MIISTACGSPYSGRVGGYPMSRPSRVVLAGVMDAERARSGTGLQKLRDARYLNSCLAMIVRWISEAPS
jgi:hypothetical protein